MSTLVTFKNAVQAHIRAALPDGPDGIQTVTTHIGEFGLDEVKRYAAAAPAVILAPLGVPDLKRGGGMVLATVNYGAFVLTKSMANADRGDIALAIIEELAKVVPFNPWGKEACAQAPKNIDAGNLYTGKVDTKGIALWAIRWQQTVQIQALDTSTLADFLTLAAQYTTPGSSEPDTYDSPQTIELPGPA